MNYIKHINNTHAVKNNVSLLIKNHENANKNNQFQKNIHMVTL